MNDGTHGKSGEAPKATPAVPGKGDAATTPAQPSEGRGKSGEAGGDDSVDEGTVDDGSVEGQ